MKKNSLKKKLLSILLAVSMAAALTAGCGKTENTENSVSAPAGEIQDKEAEDLASGETSNEEVTITIWHQSVVDTDPVKIIIEESVEEYKKLHPNVTIVQDGIEGEQYKTKIKTAFAAGEAPDISYMFSGGSFVKPYIDAGYLLPIEDYVSSETLDLVLPGMYWYDIISARTAGNAGIEAAFGDTSKFNAPEFAEAAAKLQELVKAGAFNDNMMSMSYNEMLEGFAAGQGAMIFQANWIHPAITDENAASNGKVTCVPFPVIDGAKGSITEFSGGTSDGYYINANCKHPREAVEYLEYLSRKIGTVGYSMGAGLPCWKADGVDVSGLTPLDVESAELMETGTSYIGWWDNVLSAEDSETYKDLVAQVMALKITPEEFAKKMAELSPSEFY